MHFKIEDNTKHFLNQLVRIMAQHFCIRGRGDIQHVLVEYAKHHIPDHDLDNFGFDILTAVNSIWALDRERNLSEKNST